MNCKCCSKKISMKFASMPYKGIMGVYECPKCGAIQGECYKGQSYQIVLPFFSKNEVPNDEWVYYDLTVLGADGIERRHGWFDPATRLITQVG